MNEIRSLFPMLNQSPDEQWNYLDNAATTLKPKSMIDLEQDYYKNFSCNVHRSVHRLGERATILYEQTRDLVQKFINSPTREQIIFTRGTTESVNLVARTWGEKFLKAGDIILLSELEHHSNIVPWQILAEKNNLEIKVIPIDDKGDIDLNSFTQLLSSKVKLLSITAVSNAIGTINDIELITSMAKKYGITVFIDAAQMASHLPIDVQKIGCDFLAFSAHKLFGPTGVGVLYGNFNLLEQMPVFLGGGDMIDEVSFQKTTYNKLPYKFEAGTPNISGVIAFSKSLDFMMSLNWDNILKQEELLYLYAKEKLSEIKNLKFIANPSRQVAILTFVLEGIHPQDLSYVLDQYKVAIRTGHHCTQPLHKKLSVTSSSRVSLSLYNNKKEIDALINAISKANKLFHTGN